MSIDIPSYQGGNLSSLRRFMDQFMQNLLQSGISIDQARAEAKIWLDNRLTEYNANLQNEKTMENLRNENREGAATTAFGRSISEKLLTPGLENKGILPLLQTLKTVKMFSPENQAAIGLQIPPDLDQQFSDAVKTGALAVGAYQDLQKMSPDLLVSTVRSIGIDNTMKLANERAANVLTTAQRGLTAAGQGLEGQRIGLTAAGQALEQKKIDLGYANLEAKGGGTSGKPEKLSDVDKAMISEIDKSQAFITEQWQASISGDLKKGSGINDPQLANQAIILLGALRNQVLNGRYPLSYKAKNFINNVRNIDQINASGKLPPIDAQIIIDAGLGSTYTGPTDFPPYISAPANPIKGPTATPAPSIPTNQAYKYTATNANGQVAGSNDGTTWYDVRTGQIIK